MKVTVYSTPTCPFCTKAKEYLKENNIEFKAIDVAEDEEARNEMIEKSGQMSVPVIIVEKGEGEKKTEQILVGFDLDELEPALGIE